MAKYLLHPLAAAALTAVLLGTGCGDDTAVTPPVSDASSDRPAADGAVDATTDGPASVPDAGPSLTAPDVETLP